MHVPTRWAARLALATIWCSASADAAEVRVERLDGKVVAGELTAWTPRQLEVAGETLPLSDVGRVKFDREPQFAIIDQSPVVRLRDGSILVGEPALTAGQANLTTSFGELSSPAASVSSVRFRPAGEAVDRAWKELLEASDEKDLFVVLRGGEPDRVNCVIGDITNESVAIRTRGRDLNVPLDRVFGLIFSGGKEPISPVFVETADGGRLGVQTVRLEGAGLIATRGGAEILIPIEQVTGVDVSAGRVRSLSEIEPSRVTYNGFGPNFDEFAWKLRRDRSAMGQPLRLGGQTYETGLWMHSGTTAAFRLPADASRFQARVGIDELQTAGRPVKLRIEGDGRPLFEETVRPEAPVEIDIEVAGRRELTIVAESPDRSGSGIREHLAVVAGRLIVEGATP